MCVIVLYSMLMTLIERLTSKTVKDHYYLTRAQIRVLMVIFIKKINRVIPHNFHRHPWSNSQQDNY